MSEHEETPEANSPSLIPPKPPKGNQWFLVGAPVLATANNLFIQKHGSSVSDTVIYSIYVASAFCFLIGVLRLERFSNAGGKIQEQIRKHRVSFGLMCLLLLLLSCNGFVSVVGKLKHRETVASNPPLSPLSPPAAPLSPSPSPKPKGRVSSPVGPIVQTISNSPGAIQAGHDVTVIGNLPKPDRVLNPDDIKKAVALLKQAPKETRIFFITFPTEAAEDGEISKFMDSLRGVFREGGWDTYKERNYHIGTFSSMGGNRTSSGEAIGCSAPTNPNAATRLAVKALSILHYPCTHSSIYQSQEMDTFALYVSVGTRIEPER